MGTVKISSLSVVAALAWSLVQGCSQAPREIQGTVEIAPEPMVVIDSEGKETLLDSWERVTVIETWPSRTEEPPYDEGAVGAPSTVTSLLYAGAIIPLSDLSYILPSAGVYVLKGGHVILANPVARSSLIPEHRCIDIERQSAHAPVSRERGQSPRFEPVTLRVFVEYSTPRQVAGYEVGERKMLPVHDAAAIVMESQALETVWEDLGLERVPASGTEGETPLDTKTSITAAWMWVPIDSLRRAPESDQSPFQGREARARITAARPGWKKVQITGWVRDALMADPDSTGAEASTNHESAAESDR